MHEILCLQAFRMLAATLSNRWHQGQARTLALGLGRTLERLDRAARALEAEAPA
jgi:hypothetical protein